MSLPDRAAKHCVDLMLQAEIAVLADVLATIGSGKVKSKRLGRVVADLAYGSPPGRVHLLAVVRERRERDAILVMWIHIDAGSRARPRPAGEARAGKAFEMTLDRLGEAVVDEVSVDINATFRFPANEYSPAIKLPGVTLSEGTSLKVLGLRLGIGDAEPGTSSIVLDVGSDADILVVPSLRVTARVAAGLLAFAVEAARAVAEKFVVQKG